MDLKTNKLNVLFSIVFKIAIIILNFLLRKFFIQILGIELQGLVNVYTSILGFLGVVDLGIGIAIVYAMYKPIVEKDYCLLKSLYNFYKKIYYIIALIIICLSLIVLPFLKYICKDISTDYNIYIGYILAVMGTVFTYLYASDVSIIQANQRTYITTLIISIVTILQNIVEVVILFVSKNFYAYLICKIFFSFITFGLLRLYVRKKFSYIIDADEKPLEKEYKKTIFKNIRALALHKIGSIIVFNMDTIIISTMLGVALVGYYSNYTTIIVALVGVMSLFFTPLTAGIGSMIVENNKEKLMKSYNFLFFFNYFLGFTSFFLYFSFINFFIAKIWLGIDYILNTRLIIIIVINYFVDFLRKSNSVFKDAAGLFYPDRYKCIVESIMNLILSIVLCLFIGIEGVLIATIITNLCISLIVEPFVVNKYLLKSDFKSFIFKQYALIAIFVASVILYSFLFDIQNVSVSNTIICVVAAIVISLGVCFTASLLFKDFYYVTKKIIKEKK